MPAIEGENNDDTNTTNDTIIPNNDGHASEDHTDASAPPDRLSIVISDAHGGSLTFMVKPNLKLKKAMDAYAERVSRDRATLRFFFDGDRVLDESTPASLAMVDGDIIEVHTEQIGGVATISRIATNSTTSIGDDTITVTTTTVHTRITTTKTTSNYTSIYTKWLAGTQHGDDLAQAVTLSFGGE